jgi:WhiB family redox-sensing transcriptional regulator
MLPCKTNPELWFSDDVQDRSEAIAECFMCPKRQECAELGQDEEHGIWGGNTPEARAALKRERVIQAEKLLVQKLRTLKSSGLTISAIARELDMPRMTVADRLRKLAA